MRTDMPAPMMATSKSDFVIIVALWIAFIVVSLLVMTSHASLFEISRAECFEILAEAKIRRFFVELVFDNFKCIQEGKIRDGSRRNGR
jgi:hypothetical protein